MLRVEGGGASISIVPGEPDLSAAAADVIGREWVASLGTLWTREPGESGTFSIAWQDPSWTTPFVNLMAEPGLVLAMTADGGIVEGRVPV